MREKWRAWRRRTELYTIYAVSTLILIPPRSRRHGVSYERNLVTLSLRAYLYNYTNSEETKKKNVFARATSACRIRVYVYAYNSRAVRPTVIIVIELNRNNPERKIAPRRRAFSFGSFVTNRRELFRRKMRFARFGYNKRVRARRVLRAVVRVDLRAYISNSIRCTENRAGRIIALYSLRKRINSNGTRTYHIRCTVYTTSINGDGRAALICLFNRRSTRNLFISFVVGFFFGKKMSPVRSTWPFWKCSSPYIALGMLAAESRDI